MDSDGAGLLTILVLVGLLATHYATGGSDEPAQAETSSTVAAQRGPDWNTGSRRTDDTVVTLGADVLFEFGTARLTPTGAGRIAEVAAKAPQGANVQVDGHTDSVGGDSANMRLSRQRAEAVSTAISTARPDLKLRVEGFGETRPVADNTRNGRDYPRGREQNRRVEIRY